MLNMQKREPTAFPAWFVPFSSKVRERNKPCSIFPMKPLSLAKVWVFPSLTFLFTSAVLGTKSNVGGRSNWLREGSPPSGHSSACTKAAIRHNSSNTAERLKRRLDAPPHARWNSPVFLSSESPTLPLGEQNSQRNCWVPT